MEPGNAFCTHCGARLEQKKTESTGEGSSLGTQFLALANDFLTVSEASPGRFEFFSQIGAQSPSQKVKIKYEAVAQLEPEKKRLKFWEKMVETSAGVDFKLSVEKTVQKGIEVGKKVNGQLLFGGKYGFEYGKLRGVVKTITREEGWTFKTAFWKPKKIV